MARELTVPAPKFTIPSLIGAAAGGAATIPMTLFMLAMHKVLPRWQKDALPPEKITAEITERANVSVDKPQLLGGTLMAHLGYGASMGSLYMTFTRKWTLPPVLKGALFGLGVWAGSYMGWLPAANFAAAGTNEPGQRNILMIIAHLIWGGVTGVLADQLLRQLVGEN
ncbi:membrane protein [Dictyobacter sp. S3.2.2.5]|uniref:Membrane protein n=1 Tax=Dictyobacter halimunensis TaxID=3026934 RepID=A0ABQ6FZQ9_9CHLR|nr:membrane protein [Dictyobacter sp. S3.2.2.5]